MPRCIVTKRCRYLMIVVVHCRLVCVSPTSKVLNCDVTAHHLCSVRIQCNAVQCGSRLAIPKDVPPGQTGQNIANQHPFYPLNVRFQRLLADVMFTYETITGSQDNSIGSTIRK